MYNKLKNIYIFYYISVFPVKQSQLRTCWWSVEITYSTVMYKLLMQLV